MSTQRTLDFILLFFGITWNIDLIKSQDAELTLTPPFQQYVREVGSSQIVACKAFDDYKGSLKWLDPKQDTVRADLDDEHRPHVESSDGLVLVFERLRHTDAGKWTCVLGDTNEKLSFQMIVVEPIKFKGNVRNKTVKRGENVVLNCEATGNPEPEITWYRNGNKIVNQAKKYEVSRDRLFIRSVTEDDKGEYHCRAWQLLNDFSSTKEIVLTLAIKHKPRGDHYKEVNFVYTSMNDNVNLSCILEATPPAKFMWYRNGSPISSIDGNYKIFTGEHFSYLNVLVENKEVLGGYLCKAINEEGYMEVNITLSLGKKADPPYQVLVQNTNTSYLELFISNNTKEANEQDDEDDDADDIINLPVLGYNIQYIERPAIDIKIEDIPMETWDNATEYYVEVYEDMVYWIPGNFTEGVSYLVRVASRNDIGLSEYTATLEFTTSKALQLIPSGFFFALVLHWAVPYFF